MEALEAFGEINGSLRGSGRIFLSWQLGDLSTAAVIAGDELGATVCKSAVNLWHKEPGETFGVEDGELIKPFFIARGTA